jgi:capsular exopolysaccharide synthesis family protein
MLGHAGDKVIMTSSFNPGSGKTFLGMNLAISYAIKGKKVVVVDLDLRKASLSTYVDSPKQGVAAYLNGDVKDFHEVLVCGTLREGLDVLPCGVLPPNPAELLYSANLEKMIKTMREEYDYVFLDCPPVEMLADSSIINKFVDLTAFVVRAGLFERSLLSKLDEMYKEKRYKNMALILNATTVLGSGYGKYGYGKYGYGKYGYGKYGYGYGYGNYGSSEN